MEKKWYILLFWTFFLTQSEAHPVLDDKVVYHFCLSKFGTCVSHQCVALCTVCVHQL